MSQYNENDPDRPLEGTPQEPLSGGAVPPPPMAEAGANPPPPPLFSQEPGPQTSAGPVPPPPPGGNATPVYGANSYGSAAPAGTLTAPTPEERNWAMFAHLSGVIIGVLGAATTLPAWGFIGPLVIWLIKKDQSPFVSDQAKEALNFCITLGIGMFVLWLVALVLVWTIIVPILVGVAMVGIGIGAIVLMIMAAVKASEGQLYRYPFTLRLIN